MEPQCARLGDLSGAVAGAPAYATYFWLLQQLEAYQVATVQWIEPLVAIIESALFLRLGLSFSMIAGIPGYLGVPGVGDACASRG